MKKVLLLFCAFGLGACSMGERYSTPVDHIYFAFDSAVLDEQSLEKLADQAMYLKYHPDETIILEGNCDERGSTEYNLALGALRAGNAEHELMRHGIEPKRMKAISYGKERPQYLGHNEEAWSKNRNVTMHVH